MVFIRILEHHKRIVQELFAIRCFNPDWNYLYTSVWRKEITSLPGLAGMPSFLRLPLSFLFYKVMKRIRKQLSWTWFCPLLLFLPHTHLGGGRGDAVPTASPAGDASLHLQRDEAQQDFLIKLPRTGSKNTPSFLLHHDPLIAERGWNC